MHPTLDNLEYFLPQFIGHLDSPHRLILSSTPESLSRKDIFLIALSP
jgi:hypothetical protein